MVGRTWGRGYPARFTVTALLWSTTCAFHVPPPFSSSIVAMVCLRVHQPECSLSVLARGCDLCCAGTPYFRASGLCIAVTSKRTKPGMRCQDGEILWEESRTLLCFGTNVMSCSVSEEMVMWSIFTNRSRQANCLQHLWKVKVPACQVASTFLC